MLTQKKRIVSVSFVMLFAILTLTCQKETLSLNNNPLANISPLDTTHKLSVGGPQHPVTEIPFEQINSKEYTIDVKEWNIPNTGTDPEKTTDNLQAAIDWAVGAGYGIVRLPAGNYLIGKYGNDIYQAGIELKSNMAFLLDKNAVIQMAPNNKWNYCAIAVTEKAYVVISGGAIVGDRDRHVYTPRKSDGSVVHDEGHLICIQNESEFITVENVLLAKANGDGILLVGQKGEGSSVKNIDIRHNNMVDNRRQGVSIVGGVDILIENNEIHHTVGTSPQFGVDIESLQYESKNITIASNYFHHNRGGDIVNSDGRNVIVEDNVLTQGEGSSYIDGPLVYLKKGDLTIRRNSITMLTVSVNNWNGIIMYSSDKPKTNSATTYIYENTCNNCGFYMYKSADLVVRDNHFINGHLAFKEMTNLTVQNNKVEHPNKCWAYRFLQVSGNASGNTYNSQPFDIPLTEEPWDGCWIY